MPPEKLHLALNHLPLIGLAFALIPLLVGLIWKSRPALISGLLVATIAGWATPFIMSTGEAAYERYEDGPPRVHLDSEVEDWLHLHEERAHTWSKLLYGTAVVATGTLLLAFFKYPLARKVSWLVCLLCLSSVGASVWIADSGGAIRRVDFRSNLPSLPDASYEAEHDHD